MKVTNLKELLDNIDSIRAYYSEEDFNKILEMPIRVGQKTRHTFGSNQIGVFTGMGNILCFCEMEDVAPV